MSNTIITTTLYKKAASTDFDSFKFRAIMNFTNRIINLYNFAYSPDDGKYTAAKAFIKKVMYTPDFTKAFVEAGRLIIYDNESRSRLAYPIYTFNVNNKNINFSTVLDDIEAYLQGEYQTHLKDASKVTPSFTGEVFSIHEIPNWQDLFGKGLFPAFKIYTFRLGNTEYYAYSIID